MTRRSRTELKKIRGRELRSAEDFSQGEKSSSTRGQFLPVSAKFRGGPMTSRGNLRNVTNGENDAGDDRFSRFPSASISRRVILADSDAAESRKKTAVYAAELRKLAPLSRSCYVAVIYIRRNVSRKPARSGGRPRRYHRDSISISRVERCARPRESLRATAI